MSWVESAEFGGHDGVELLPLLLVERAHAERFEVELQGGNGGFELVGDAVDEVGLPLIQPDLLDRECQPEGKSEQDEGEGDDADGQGSPSGPLGEQDDPADHQGDIEHHQADAERHRQVERASFAEVDSHDVVRCDEGTAAPSDDRILHESGGIACATAGKCVFTPVFGQWLAGYSFAA